MPLTILDLPKQFRPGTSIVYPPFKNGKYMEEYVYDYLLNYKDSIQTHLVYIPIFWTNLQIHPAFQSMRSNYNLLLKQALKRLPSDTKYFTIVQHDDGPLLDLPKETIVFGACTGTVPLPLIYEDVNNTLLNYERIQNKEYLASFVGTLTHAIREKMAYSLQNKSDVKLITQPSTNWTSKVSESASEQFMKMTIKSKFCLAPRGYGRSSFRFFEAMLLDCVPVYFWNDIEWLPYKEILDYSKFAVSIQEKDIPHTYDILKLISEEKYLSMMEEIKRVRRYFSLEGMAEYIKSYIEKS
jgi:hypothetical protein